VHVRSFQGSLIKCFKDLSNVLLLHAELEARRGGFDLTVLEEINFGSGITWTKIDFKDR